MYLHKVGVAAEEDHDVVHVVLHVLAVDQVLEVPEPLVHRILGGGGVDPVEHQGNLAELKK